MACGFGYVHVLRRRVLQNLSHTHGSRLFGWIWIPANAGMNDGSSCRFADLGYIRRLQRTGMVASLTICALIFSGSPQVQAACLVFIR